MRFCAIGILLAVFLLSAIALPYEGPVPPLDAGRTIRIVAGTKAVECGALISLPPPVTTDIQWLLRGYRDALRIYSPEIVPDAKQHHFWRQMRIIEVQYGFVVIDWETGSLSAAEYPDDLPIPPELSRIQVWAIWETLQRRTDFALSVAQGSQAARPAFETLEARLLTSEHRLGIRINRQTGAILKK